MRRRWAIGILLVTPVALLGARALSLPKREPATSAAAAALESTERPGPQTTPTGGHPHREPPQRGVALGMFAEDVSFSYAPLLNEIVALGATHVSLVVPIYQTHGASTELHLHTRLSPTLETIADTIRDARRAGLEVTLFPIVRLSHPRDANDWRGTLQPSSRDAWFSSYGQILGDLASLGELTGATRLAVGSELSTLDGDLARWESLLRLIRAVFKGSLVYSANWDHYKNAKLFELVDEIGVTAYFKLREPSEPADIAILTASWQRIGLEIENALAGFDKPFVFTEVGYRSREGATASPWDENPGGKSDLEEQRRGFEAFRQAWTAPKAAHPRLDGVYIWNWYGFGGPGTISYTPRGKPALATIKKILADFDQP